MHDEVYGHDNRDTDDVHGSNLVFMLLSVLKILKILWV